MALQLVTVTFTAQSQVACSFPAPLSGTYGIGGWSFTPSAAPFNTPVNIGFDAIVPGSPNCSVNAYASDTVSGTLVFEVVDLP